MKTLKRLYKWSGSFGHLMLYYCFSAFLLHIFSIIMNLFVWDVLPVLTPWDSALAIAVVGISDLQYKIKNLPTRTNHDNRNPH